jgi:hypothetical protein
MILMLLLITVAGMGSCHECEPSTFGKVKLFRENNVPANENSAISYACG